MALRATKIMNAKQAKLYFQESLVRDDYYANREVVGVWGGALAKRLELEGKVDQERYFQIVDNINPATGENLTPRTRSARRIGFDFTFSVPKSVSLHQGLLGSDELHTAFDSAVKATLETMEQEMQVRVSGPDRFMARRSGNFLYAAFDHFTARPVEGKGCDPHTHRHVVVFNATWDENEGRIKAADHSSLLLNRPYMQALYHNHLARNLRDLGYEIERTADNFEIKGHDRATLRAFSRRTSQIEAVAREKGIHNAAEKAALGAKTRAGKEKGLSIADHRRSWWKRLTPEEAARVSEIEAARSTGREAADEGAAREAIAYALAESLERKSVVPRQHLLTAALKAGVGRVTVEELESELARAAENGEIITAEWEGEACITTAEILEEEDRMIARVRDSQGQCAPLGEPGRPLPKSRTGQARPADWEAAAKAILASRDQVTVMLGKPGAGKTTVMQTVADALARDGKRIAAFAPSAIASRGNQVKAGFGEAETLAKLFVSETLQEKVRGQVIWVDEASLIGTRDMVKVLDLADKLDARLILTGDVRQHQSVAQGDALRTIETFAQIEAVRLNIIRRQSESTYRRAVEEISEGHLTEGFRTLSEMGAIVEIEDHEERYATLARDYAEFDARGKSIVVVAPTHYERRLANASIRAELQARGRIDETDERSVTSWESKGWQESQKADPVFYAAGDKVKFHVAAPGFRTGSTATVTGVADGAVQIERADGTQGVLPLQHPARFEVFSETEITLAKGDRILVTRNGRARSTTPRGRPHELLNGRTYEIDGFAADGDIRLTNGMVVPAGYANLTYGYGVTSYRAQSLGEDVALVAESEASFAAASAEQWLVSTSRGKSALRVYTDDRDGLEEAVERSARRLSASELVQAERARQAEAAEEQAALDRTRDWVMALARRYEREETEREGVYEFRAPHAEERRRQNVPVRG